VQQAPVAAAVLAERLLVVEEAEEVYGRELEEGAEAKE
jgi:hypothetical protein